MNSETERRVKNITPTLQNRKQRPNPNDKALIDCGLRFLGCDKEKRRPNADKQRQIARLLIHIG